MFGDHTPVESMQYLKQSIKTKQTSMQPGARDGWPHTLVPSCHIKDLLFEALKECTDQGELTTSMKQGLIILIQKPNKDILNLDNWRPIYNFRNTVWFYEKSTYFQ